MFKIISYLILFLGIDLIPRDKKLVMYKECFKEIQTNHYFGYCNALTLIWLRHSNLDYSKIFDKIYYYKFLYFPELYIYRPFKKQDKGFWWNRYDNNIRLRYLDKAIKYLTKLEL